jgi:hypothetical protein
MKNVAAVILLFLAATTAATLIVHSRGERDAALQEARAEHEELIRHLGQIERLLTVAPHRDITVAPVPAAAPADQVSTRRESLAESPTAAQHAAHEERLRAGNAFVDDAIASGTWSPSDFEAFVTATRDLGPEERARMLERLTTAINTDQVHFDPARRSP